MKDLLKHPSTIVVVALIVLLGAVCTYLDWNKEQTRKATEAAVLTGNGYTNVTMLDDRGSCPRGIYARWYVATNPAGEQERGLVCIVYSDDTPYIIPTYKK